MGLKGTLFATLSHLQVPFVFTGLLISFRNRPHRPATWACREGRGLYGNGGGASGRGGGLTPPRLTASQVGSGGWKQARNCRSAPPPSLREGGGRGTALRTQEAAVILSGQPSQADSLDPQLRGRAGRKLLEWQVLAAQFYLSCPLQGFWNAPCIPGF